MGADGKNLKQLTQNRKIGWTSGHPAWSPDGKYIAYDSGKRDRGGNSQSTIFIMDADGKNPRPLITRANRPAWSPDGQKIVFVSNQDGNDEIYMIDVDGKNLKRLTMNRYQDTDPCWIEKP
jgi:TolB protein